MATNQDKQVEVSPATSTTSLRSQIAERSPSVSSNREDKWPELLLSRPEKSYYFKTKCKFNIIMFSN